MDILVLDQEFNRKAVIDTYESLIWTDRYYGYGDFELYLPFNSYVLDMVRQDYYLQIADSTSTMIVESIQIRTDSESGNHLIITGRSLESILERRVIWPQITLSGTIYQAMRTIINDAIINPTKIKFSNNNTYIKRKIDNFIFEACTDSTITGIQLEPTEFTGDIVYEKFLNWCQENEIGFDITFEEEYEYKSGSLPQGYSEGQKLYNQFVLRLYRGVDRTYEQTDNKFVVFSPTYDNVISTDYTDDTSPWRNFAIVAGEGEGSEREVVMYGDVDKDPDTRQYKTVGINHRELYVDARDVQSSELPEGMTYADALKVRGAEKLNECLKDIQFYGEVEARRQFVYGRDFFMGDIVEITNEYGIQGAARVIEYIHNDTDSGSDVYPTFEAIQNYGYDAEESG